MSITRWNGGMLVLATLVAAGFTWSVILDAETPFSPQALADQPIENAG